MDDDNKKIIFTTSGAWLGLLAYLAVGCVLALIFIFGYPS